MRGVVKDVSVIAKDAYAQVWRMYPASLQDVTSVRSYAQSHTVVALARSSGIFRPSGRGIAKRVKDINAVQTEMLMDIMEQPDEIVAHVNHVGQHRTGFADVVHTVPSGIAHCSF